jgi:hypothetical protein
MQYHLLGDSPVSATRVPTLIVRRLNAEHIAVRFEQIGDRWRFAALLGRFNSDYPLATCQYLTGQAWWIMAAMQSSEIEVFAKKVGLRLVRE